MGGKKQANQKSKANVQKEKDQKMADLTFGLKNKNKSKQVQKYVEAVKKNVYQDNIKHEQDKKNQKIQQQKKKDELAFLQSLGFDDKKKQKEQQKQLEEQKLNDAKTGKIDIYTDYRDDKEQNETNEDWDQEKLESVIKKKHGHRKCKTDKICMYFIGAIEKSRYGWFWKCPNGEECIYKHALPEGWVLRKPENAKKEISLEEWVEKERNKLQGDLTPLTKELFEDWKEKWLAKMAKDKEKEVLATLAEKTKNKKFLDPNFKMLSGRSLFVYKPEEEEEKEKAEEAEGGINLQDLIKNRKKIVEEDEDEEEEDEQEILDVELPSDED